MPPKERKLKKTKKELASMALETVAKHFFAKPGEVKEGIQLAPGVTYNPFIPLPDQKAVWEIVHDNMAIPIDYLKKLIEYTSTNDKYLYFYHHIRREERYLKETQKKIVELGQIVKNNFEVLIGILKRREEDLIDPDTVIGIGRLNGRNMKKKVKKIIKKKK